MSLTITNSLNISKEEMVNKLVTINNVQGYLKENGTAYLDLEDVARGLGFTEIAKSGNEVVRWRTVRGYLTDIGAIPTSRDDNELRKIGREGLPTFIPENIFYKLAFKASNETARRFQANVADEVLSLKHKRGEAGHDPGGKNLKGVEI